jgi:hypothetical protein
MRITDAPETWRKHRRGSRRLVMVDYPYSIIYFKEADALGCTVGEVVGVFDLRAQRRTRSV